MKFVHINELKKYPGQSTLCEQPNDALLSAAKSGDLETVKSALKCQKSDVNHSDNGGRTPLYMASWKGHGEVVRKLLEEPDIDVNSAEKNVGATALYIASAVGQEEVVEHLVGHPKIEVNKWLFTTEMTPLWKASENGHAGVVRLLLGHPKLDINKARTNSAKTTPLGIATYLNKTEVVKLLLGCPQTRVTDTGKLASGKTGLEFAREKGYTAIVEAYELRAKHMLSGMACCGVLNVSGEIRRAAEEGELKRLEELQHCTVEDINQVDGKGRTPLYLAILNGHLEVVKKFLEDPDIDVNRVEDESGTTALYLASATGNKEIVQLLLGHPKINVNKGANVTALSIASENGHEEVVKLHLRCPKTVVNLQDKFGKTALDKAREKGFTRVIEAFASRARLLRSGHTCCSESTNRELLKAAEKGNGEGIDLFLQCPGGDVNHNDSQGRTPLYLASENGHTPIVKTLLRFRNINVNGARTDYGATALFAASQFAHEDVVRLLLNHPKIQVNKGLTRKETQWCAICICFKDYFTEINFLIYEDLHH